MKITATILLVLAIGACIGWLTWEFGPLLYAIATGQTPKGYQGLL
jgi:hypothetical protein